MPSLSDILTGFVVVGGLGAIAFTAYEVRQTLAPAKTPISLTFGPSGSVTDNNTGEPAKGLLPALLSPPGVQAALQQALTAQHPAAPIPPKAPGSTPSPTTTVTGGLGGSSVPGTGSVGATPAPAPVVGGWLNGLMQQVAANPRQPTVRTTHFLK